MNFAYRVFYLKPEAANRRDLICGVGHCKRNNIPLPHWDTLTETHVEVKSLEARDPNAVYDAMQGEVWSPNGEARPLIEKLGLWHTSMSVGDIVIERDGRWEQLYMCDSIGFKAIGKPRSWCGPVPHMYAVEVQKPGDLTTITSIDIEAPSRASAAKKARTNGWEVRSVNMIG